MAMIRSAEFRRSFFGEGSRPSEKQVRRWVENEDVPGKVTAFDVWVDAEHFVSPTGCRTGITRPDLNRLYGSCRQQAGKRGISWALEMDDLLKVWERQGGRCAVSGIRFSRKGAKPGQRRPWFPSIDRRDSAAGYTPENVRLVCVAANLAMNEWGEGVLRDLAKAVATGEKRG